MSRSRFIIPRNPRDKMLILFMPIIIPLAIGWEFGVILPKYHQNITSVVVVHMVAVAFIIMNIFGNILLVIRTDASGRQSYLPSVQKPDWKYCYECKLNAPPRSYHCPICNECILKRDHHCMFTGNCVGYHNHRYYLVGLTYILIGALYAVIYQSEYCFTEMGGYSWSTLLSLFAPHFALFLGYLSFYGVFVSIIQIVSLVILFSTAYLVVTQIISVLRGQTRYEHKVNIDKYNLGWQRNLVDVLGQRWCLVWLSPTISSPLQGDGLKFTASVEYEDVKRM